MQVILYGAGKKGVVNIKQLQSMGKGELVYAFCDSNAESIKEKEGIKVVSYDEAKAMNLPFIIAVSNLNVAYKEIKEKLEEDGVKYYSSLSEFLKKEFDYDTVKESREYCAFYHENSMEEYFSKVEAEEHLNIFWGENSVFLKMFKNLDLKNVVELACGRGRHVQKYIDQAGDITLVDILEKNIEYTKERFADCPNIHFYKNNGYDLSELSDNQYTSLFTYDSMVHFELLDIYNYLKETYRILVPGGYALYHHSNESSDYKNSFVNCNNPGGRNFMDKKIFAYLAYRAGFEIMEQQVIDWKIPELDCITLVRKPELEKDDRKG